MYWRMYSGHNCTNYIAYRMIRAGMSTERPWSGGSGNAYYWGYAMDDITDRTPAVGAVAWWDRGVPGAGSSGHVAYVEKVVSSTEIVISEDSWSGDFHWRRIYKSGSGWPTGFIHFVDKKTLKNTTRPCDHRHPAGRRPTARVQGRVQAGGPPDPAVVRRRCRRPGRDHRLLHAHRRARRQGDHDARPRPPGGLRRHDRRRRRPPPRWPRASSVAVRPPAITGSPEVGQVLTATRGTWSPAPASTSFQWKADGVRLEGFTTSKLTLTNAMVGKRITVVEKPVRPGYKKILGVSAPFGPVVEGTVAAHRPVRRLRRAPLRLDADLHGGHLHAVRRDDQLPVAARRRGRPGRQRGDVQARGRGRRAPDRRAGHAQQAALPVRGHLGRRRARDHAGDGDGHAGGRSRAAVVKVRVAAAGLATRPGGIVTVTHRQADRPGAPGRRSGPDPSGRPRQGQAGRPRLVLRHRRGRAAPGLGAGVG